ncbi:MFS transporter [Streptomyces sp. NPDC057908]|uniref:MFS transporter n=1 Tax=Streptomyces sp. NPDC057908 TaxID=3346276 RepID=UPI0036E1BA4A
MGRNTPAWSRSGFGAGVPSACAASAGNLVEEAQGPWHTGDGRGSRHCSACAVHRRGRREHGRGGGQYPGQSGAGPGRRDRRHQLAQTIATFCVPDSELADGLLRHTPTPHPHLAGPSASRRARQPAHIPAPRRGRQPLSATGAFAGYTYIVKFLGEVSGFSQNTVSALLMAFDVACLAGVSIPGALLDRFPHATLTTAIATQAVGMLGLYVAGADPAAAVVFLVLMGGALGPVFMATQNEMLRCAPGRTDFALAANSGAYNAGIAAGASIGGLVLPLADVRGAFLVGGLLTIGACVVLLGEWLLPAAKAARTAKARPNMRPLAADRGRSPSTRPRTPHGRIRHKPHQASPGGGDEA